MLRERAVSAAPPTPASQWPVLLIAIPFGLLIGLVVGALGGGGAILALPLLVYVLDEGVGPATTASLVVVGLAAAIGAGARAGDRQVCWRVALSFAGPAAVGALLGTLGNHAVDPRVLILFSCRCCWSRRRRHGSPPGTDDRTECPPTAVGRTVAAGLGVGRLTGFFGVGGGFLIVPVLTLWLGVGFRRAVGTSLLVITITAAAAVASHLLAGAQIDVPVTAALATATAAGALAGTAAARRLPQRALKQGFAVVVVAVALFLLADTLLLGGPPHGELRPCATMRRGGPQRSRAARVARPRGVGEATRRLREGARRAARAARARAERRPRNRPRAGGAAPPRAGRRGRRPRPGAGPRGTREPRRRRRRLTAGAAGRIGYGQRHDTPAAVRARPARGSRRRGVGVGDAREPAPRRRPRALHPAPARGRGPAQRARARRRRGRGGVLHDVVEKTSATVEDVRDRFGDRTAEIVAAVTEDDSIDDFTARKAALRGQLETAGPDAHAVYAADKIAKARSCARRPPPTPPRSTTRPSSSGSSTTSTASRRSARSPPACRCSISSRSSSGRCGACRRSERSRRAAAERDRLRAPGRWVGAA